MTKLNPWLKRSLAAAAVTLTGLVGLSSDVQAGTATGDFEVRVTVTAACTLVTSDLQFPNYTTGQLSPIDGQVDFVVECPGASNLPVQLRVSPFGGGSVFEMANGLGDVLTYTLSDSAGGAAMAWNEDRAFGPIVDGTPQNLTVHGQIPGGQTVPEGSYAQQVTATLTF